MNAIATALQVPALTRPAPAPMRASAPSSTPPAPATQARTLAMPSRDGQAAAGRPAGAAGAADRVLRERYLAVLGWAFTLFNSVRVVAYLPTVWAIFQSGDSSQHSLWTWCTWLGANLTMALWLRERNGGRFCRAAAVNLGNASMCSLTLGLILWFRF